MANLNIAISTLAGYFFTATRQLKLTARDVETAGKLKIRLQCEFRTEKCISETDVPDNIYTLFVTILHYKFFTISTYKTKKKACISLHAFFWG